MGWIDLAIPDPSPCGGGRHVTCRWCQLGPVESLQAEGAAAAVVMDGGDVVCADGIAPTGRAGLWMRIARITQLAESFPPCPVISAQPG